MRGALVSLCLLVPSTAAAVTSTASVPSSFSGNGHNVSFDGRLFMVRDGNGWSAMLLRPEAITYRGDGLPDASGPMWSPRVLVYTTGNPATMTENALAICEPDPARAPFRCDAAGNPAAAGPYDCYDVQIFDSDAVTPAPAGFLMRRRHLLLWVRDAKTASAAIDKWELSSTLEPLSPTIRGIEPTVTRDGKLLVWQGHPDNDGKIDILMYAVNANACAASGWSSPKVISSMATDPAVVGTYRLAERALRASDGQVFAAGQLVHGGYPWLFPGGEAVVFTASPMPCRGVEDPPGCGPRRNSWAVLGYPTNWGVAIVDGGVNPSSEDVVRLFFSSPGPTTFAELPITPGLDVWPFMGSNTANYVELVFDDGLDGDYAGYWHFNENVLANGDLDRTRVPDVSGYFNTGALQGGLLVPAVNDGVLGRALAFDGVDDRVEVPHSVTLTPVNGITLDVWIRPTAEPDCDGNNNYRVVLAKGGLGDGSYSVVLEENRALQVRFFAAGQQRPLVTPALPLGAWSHVSCEYDGPSGAAGCWVDDAQVASETWPAGTLTASTAPLSIGAPGARPACPNGDGAFSGMLDELAISRYARRLGTAPVDPPDAGPIDPGLDGGGNPGNPDAGGDDPGGDATGGCGCRASGGTVWGGAGLIAIMVLPMFARVRTAGRRRRRPGS
jgi:hypothetical protein